ncbi:MAG: hypothetical protein IT324_05255 [Anaerolineae bacterium]|nr:hypothetical protein [Anaerolineae bacterium]
MIYLPHEDGQSIVGCALGCSPIILILIIFFLAMTGPTVGNVFSNIVQEL